MYLSTKPIQNFIESYIYTSMFTGILINFKKDVDVSTKKTFYISVFIYMLLIIIQFDL